MKKVLLLLAIILCVYPLVLILQLCINGLSGEHQLYWAISELSRKNMLLLFINDWIESLFFIFLAVISLYLLNYKLAVVNKYILPVFMVFLMPVLFYFNLPSAFIYSIIISFILVIIQHVITNSEKT